MTPRVSKKKGLRRELLVVASVLVLLVGGGIAAYPAALHKVAIRQVGQVCPDNAYDSYTETSTGAGSFTLCLMLNVEEGECLSGLGSPDTLARVDCAGAEVEATVLKLVTGTADETACAEGSTPVVYPQPPTTYCLGKPAP
jgi:hypothetical protein